MTRCLITVGLCLALLLSGVNVGAGQNLRISFDSDSQESIKKGVVDQQIRIMPQFNPLNFGLGWFDNHNFFYEKSLSSMFFQDHVINVKLTDIDFDATNITLKLFHPVKGVGIITFVFNENLISSASDEVIQDILQNTLGDVNHRYVFGNPESRRYHLYSCLHSETSSHLIRMSIEEAEQQGFQPGGFCFKKVVYLPDLTIEREIEIEWLARLREHALFMDGSPKQETLNLLGHRILENWPFQLLGYNYSFYLIDSHRMTTMAIPTGKIFITTSLMDALESEQELEALLVRAIAHIENRHSLKQYYSKTNDVKNKQFLQKLTMATGSFTGIIAGPGAGAIKALGNLPFHVSSSDHPLSSGYENDLEKAADTVAALYFDIQQKDRRHLSAVIRKLQLAALYFNIEQTERFDFDAAMSSLEINEMTKQLYLGIRDKKKDVRFNERAKRVEHIKFRYLIPDNSFVLQKGRRLPVQLEIEYQSIIQNENKVMVYISDKSLLHRNQDSDHRSQVILFVTDKHGKHRFKLLKRYTTKDMWGARLTFEAAREKRGPFLEGLQDLEIEIIEPQGPTDKGSDRKIEKFNFVKGRLDPENSMANRHQADS
jgi:hypothetical protein